MKYKTALRILFFQKLFQKSIFLGLMLGVLEGAYSALSYDFDPYFAVGKWQQGVGMWKVWLFRAFFKSP